MPLFDYACRNCGETSELLIRGDEKPKCPKCGSGKLDRQLSVPAAHTSGSSGPETCCGSSCAMPRECCGGQCPMG